MSGALALVAAGIAACSGATERHDGPNDETPGRAALSLTYAEGTTLRRVDLASGADRVTGELPSLDVWAAPAGPWLATVVDAARPAPGQEDFAAQPSVRLIDPRSGTVRRLGPGFAPLWSPDGDRLAWLRPVEDRLCSGEECAGLTEVMVVEPETDVARRVAGPGSWTLLAWAGEEVLVSRLDDPGATVALGPDGRRRALPIPAQEIWGASPDGRWLVRVAGSGISFMSLTEKSLTAGFELRGGGVLAEGAWSPSGQELAAIQVRPRPGGVPSSRVVIISIGERHLRALEGSAGAAGNVLWSGDEEHVAFARSAGPRGGRLEAVVCRVTGGGCRALFSWVRGVVLLALR